MIAHQPLQLLVATGAVGDNGSHRHGGRYLVKTVQTADLLNQVNLPLNVNPPAGNPDLQAAITRLRNVKDKVTEQFRHPLGSQLDADHFIAALRTEQDADRLPGSRVVIHHASRHGTASQFSHQPGGPIEGHRHHADIDATLETVG